jgi:hypothetical protein
MEVAQAANRLRSLASDSAKRSKTAVLRDVFMDIEVAIQAGVSQVVIVEELRTLGLDINASAFRSALRRLRSERSSRHSARSMLSASTGIPLPSFAGEYPRSIRTTSAGSLYDAGALCRLFRAPSAEAQSTCMALSE